VDLRRSLLGLGLLYFLELLRLFSPLSLLSLFSPLRVLPLSLLRLLLG